MTVSSLTSPPLRPPASLASCCNLPGIAIDVDNPADMQELLAQPGETRTQSLLRQWNLDGRFPAIGTEGP